MFKLPRQLQFEVVVVDDNSPDGTAMVCKQLQKIYGADRIKLHQRAGKLGLGKIDPTAAAHTGCSTATPGLLFDFRAMHSHPMCLLTNTLYLNVYFDISTYVIQVRPTGMVLIKPQEISSFSWTQISRTIPSSFQT